MVFATMASAFAGWWYIPEARNLAPLNISLLLGVAFLKMWLNRTYSLQQATSHLDSSLFLGFCAASPVLTICFSEGTVLCIAVLLCMALLFSCYDNRQLTPRVFLIFVILSAMTITEYVYVLYILVFVVGCAQMRIMNGRTAVAIVLGLITPWWIALGFGIIDRGTLTFPDFTNILSTYSSGDSLAVLLPVAAAALLSVAGWVANFPRMIAYNAHRRAYNGTINVLWLATLLGVTVNYDNVHVYAPILFVLASYLLSQVWVGRRNTGGWVGAIIVFLIFVILFACDIVLK